MTPVTLAAETVEQAQRNALEYISRAKTTPEGKAILAAGVEIAIKHLIALLPTPEPAGRDADGLLPCPFCGGQACLVHEDDHTDPYPFYVECQKCHAKGNVADDEFWPVKKWNTRALAQPSAEVVERMSDELAEAVDLFLKEPRSFTRMEFALKAYRRARTGMSGGE